MSPSRSYSPSEKNLSPQLITSEQQILSTTQQIPYIREQKEQQTISALQGVVRQRRLVNGEELEILVDPKQQREFVIHRSPNSYTLQDLHNYLRPRCQLREDLSALDAIPEEDTFLGLTDLENESTGVVRGVDTGDINEDGRRLEQWELENE